LNTKPGTQWQSLSVTRISYPVCQAQFTNPIDRIGIVIFINQMQHQVQSSRATSASVYLTIHFKQVGINISFRKTLGKAGQCFPMDGAALVFQKACIRHNPSACAQTRNGGVSSKGCTKPTVQNFV